MKYTEMSPEQLNHLAAEKKKQKPPLAIPGSAKRIHREIVDSIRTLLKSSARSPLESEFAEGYRAVLRLLERFQNDVISHSAHRITCTKGCTRCCFHWVEDVYSFEAEIIADYIRTHMQPYEIEKIIAQFRQDTAEIEKLDVLVAEKLEAYKSEKDIDGIDPVDLLLASFYQLRRPCALLTPEGACAIYPVRPLTCRVYLSFSDPHYCDPDYINISDVRTHVLDLDESASRLLDRLHFKFDRHDGDMGLRSLVPKCLAEKKM
jgi:Fe-S-cluster containining protein